MNKFTNEQRAEVLVQALPYIKRYAGEVVVIKYGGNAMINEALKSQVMQDIILLWTIGVKVVLVHGGGPEITELMAKLGKKSEFINGLRVTDSESVDIVQMVLAGKVNKSLVKYLNILGGKAIGLSGVDAKLIEADFKDEKLGYVGNIKKVNIDIINDMLVKDYIPVVSTIACDDKGNTFNINGDDAAAWIAGALNAKRLIMMTDIAGVLKDKDNPESLISEITLSEAEELREKGIITGGMIPKVECCTTALKHGVKKAIIMDGRVPHSIIMELLTNQGAGTMIVGD